MSVLRIHTGGPDTSALLPSSDDQRDESLGLDDLELHGKPSLAKFRKIVLEPFSDERELVTQHVRAWQAGSLYVAAVILWIIPLIGCGLSKQYGSTDCVVQPNNSVSISSSIRKGSFATSFAYFGGIFFLDIFFVLTQFEKSFFVTITTLLAVACASIPLLVPISGSSTKSVATADKVHTAFAFIGGAILLLPLTYILTRLYHVARKTQPQASKLFWLLLVWTLAYIISGIFVAGVAIANSAGTSSQDVQSFGIIVAEYLALAALVCAVRVVIKARLVFEVK